MKECGLHRGCRATAQSVAGWGYAAPTVTSQKLPHAHRQDRTQRRQGSCNPYRAAQAHAVKVVRPVGASSIAIAGIGGAGCNMVRRHWQSMENRPGIQHLAVNTDRNSLSRIDAMPGILLHADASGAEAVMPWLAQCKALYLLAGLGGRAGSIATPALARLARNAGLHTVALVGMPWEWEGCRRKTAAQHALESVREYAAETVVVHGDEVAQRLGENALVDQFIAGVDALLLRELDARMG